MILAKALAGHQRRISVPTQPLKRSNAWRFVLETQAQGVVTAPYRIVYMVNDTIGGEKLSERGQQRYSGVDRI